MSTIIGRFPARGDPPSLKLWRTGSAPSPRQVPITQFPYLDAHGQPPGGCRAAPDWQPILIVTPPYQSRTWWAGSEVDQKSHYEERACDSATTVIIGSGEIEVGWSVDKALDYGASPVYLLGQTKHSLEPGSH
jgi:hypothetical protein